MLQGITELRSLEDKNAQYISSLFHAEALDAMAKVLRARLVALAQANQNSIFAKQTIHRDVDMV